MLMAGKDWRGQALPNALSGFGLVVQGVLLILCGLAVLTSASAQSAPPVPIVALGDSLTAGYGLPANAAFPVVLEKALKARGYSVSIINAGVSGDTSQGGLDRLDWSVPDGIRGVILELGANDALRARNPADTMRALDGIITRLKARNIEVMLCGMLAPPNLGAEYTRAFEKVFTDLAQRHGLVFYPFFLDGVAGEPKLNQRDGIHPTAEGVRVITGRILPKAEEFIKRLAN